MPLPDYAASLNRQIGLQNDAQQRRFQLATQGLSSPIGPLPDPQWDAYFGAVAQAANGKRVKYGYETQTGPDLSSISQWPGRVAAALPMALSGLYGSDQLGTPVRGR